MDIESEGYLGRRALHKAVPNNQLAMADMLLQRGPDVDAQGHQGYIPLTTACSMDDAEDGMVKLLLEHKADTAPGESRRIRQFDSTDVCRQGWDGRHRAPPPRSRSES